jgi:hypothetical protein
MKKSQMQYPAPYEPPKDRSAIDKIMNRPVEEHFARRIPEGVGLPGHQTSEMEATLDPRGSITELREQMCTPKGNAEAIDEIINKWITQRIAFDQLFESEMLELSQRNNNINDLEIIFNRKHENEKIILGLFATKKKLLTLPGISFTQVNMAHGAQQINNGSNGNEKIKEKI